MCRMIYIIEDNGVYGLTKGQFSATADVGSKLKTGVVNDLPPMDCCLLGIELGATFVARSFSGDKRQLQALLKAAVGHKGLAVIDVISPCVTFNDHEGSTKSYAYMRDHDLPLQQLDFVPCLRRHLRRNRGGRDARGDLHDGSRLILKKLGKDYDPTDKMRAVQTLHEAAVSDQVITGLIYLNTEPPDAGGDAQPGGRTARDAARGPGPAVPSRARRDCERVALTTWI